MALARRRFVSFAIVFSLIVTFTPTFTASGACAEEAIHLSNPQPDPRSIIYIPEGGESDFSINVTAEDTEDLDMRYTWYVDNVAFATGDRNFTYRPDYDSSGYRTVKVVTKDGAGGESSFEWSANVLDVNRKPRARIISPVNNTQYDGGELLISVEAMDPDGDDITLHLYERGRLQKEVTFQNGSGSMVWKKDFKRSRSLRIEVVVSDGELESRYITALVVTGPGCMSGPGTGGWIFVIVVVSVPAPLSVYVLRGVWRKGHR